MSFTERVHLCRLAGFALPGVIASKHFHWLTGGERELIRETVRAHRDELHESSWGLA